MANLGARIHQRRRLFDLSQEDLGEAIGTSQKQVSKYERNQNDPTADVLMKIAVALDTTTDWLVGLTDNPERPLNIAGDLDDMEREIIQLVRARKPTERQKIVNVIKALA